MPKITFIKPDGISLVVDAKEGVTLMQAGIDGGINGIVAECGGCCQCATCHVYVAPAWQARHGLTPAQYQTTFNDLVGQGYRLELVNGYSVGGDDRIVAIWTK